MQWRKNKHLFELLKKNDGLFSLNFSQRRKDTKMLGKLLCNLAALRDKIILQSELRVL